MKRWLNACLYWGVVFGLVNQWSVGLQAQTAEAAVGGPFGVVTLAIPGSHPSLTHQVGGYRCVADGARPLYPVFSGGDRVNVGPTQLHFLFRGPPPRQVTIFGERAQTFAVRIARAPRQHSRALTRWWKEYRNELTQQEDLGGVPGFASRYFLEMLESRVDPQVRFEKLRARLAADRQSSSWEPMQLLLGQGELREYAVENLWASSSGPANQPLPPSPEWHSTPDEVLPFAVTPMEPLATRVPDNCYYIRFGSFSNYLWFQELMDEHATDIANTGGVSGTVGSPTERQQQQLGLKQNVLAKLFGDKVIQDFALIGYDLYLDDGAATGVLLHAANELLTADLAKQRQTALRANRDFGATEQTIVVGEKTISFMSTPDNRLRSFYVRDGRFHLVTNCQKLATEFILAPDRGATLADSPQFHQVRREHPHDSGDTVFAFFSSPFFQHLAGSHYQVELARRFRSEATFQCLTLATHIARAEGMESSIEQMLRAGLLPPSLTPQRIAAEFLLADGNYVDRARGVRGTYVPIPDVLVDRVTAEEAAIVARNHQFYVENWRQFDPLMFAARRHRLQGTDTERIALTAKASPFDPEKLSEYLSLLAPPTGTRITPAPGDILFVQAALQGGAWSPDVGTHHLLFGIQDSATPWPLPPENFWDTLKFVRAVPAYLASWPRLGLLDLIPLRLTSDPDPWGFSRLPLGLWRLDRELFTALGFEREVLGWAAEQITVSEQEHPAQIRLYVGDLSQSSMRPFIDGLHFRRASSASLGNARWMNFLGQQLELTPQQAQGVTAQLLGGLPNCPLGGEYVISGEPNNPFWASTAFLGDAKGHPATDVQAPVLDWFRGLSADLLHDNGTLRIRAELDIHRRKPRSLLELPVFDLLQKGRPDVLPPPQRAAPPKGPVKF